MQSWTARPRRTWSHSNGRTTPKRCGTWRGTRAGCAGMGLTQVEFARRIDVSHETIRNWEQGKRCPTGAARTLLRILDKAPESTLRVLG